MSYQVIARKYRPQRFADVVGQEHVTQTLANAIAQNRIAHAYLFCGPRGTGKTTVARIFAKCLNCTGGPNVDFSDDDERCQEITEGRSLDVLEIDGASNNGVEQVRELRDTVKFAPAASRFKIFIIDEVHMLSTAAFNALLKTLEEPPAHVKFMFATTDPEKVLPTILSRCQRFDLRRIPVALIVKHLAHISKLEQVDANEAALHAIARGADGGMRDAESALDQLISFCGNHIEESDVLSMFGLTSSTQVLAIALGILRGDAGAVLRELDGLARHGKDLSRLLSDVLSHFRNLLVYQVSGGDLTLLEVSETEGAGLKEHAALAGADVLTRVMEVLTESEGRMRDAASKKIFLEVAFLKAIQARKSLGIDSVLEQLKQLRSQGPRPASAAPPSPAGTIAPPVAPATAPKTSPAAAPSTVAPRPATPPISTPPPSLTVTTAKTPGPLPAGADPAAEAPASRPSPSAEGAVDLAALWPQLVEAVGRVSAFTRSYLLEAFPVSHVGSIFTIGFEPEFADHIELVNNSKNIELLQTKLKELGLPGTYVKFVKATPPTDRVKPAAPATPEPTRPKPAPAAAPAASATNGAPPPAAAEAAKAVAPAPPVQLNAADFKDDPLIQKALELFRGRIVEVRS